MSVRVGCIWLILAIFVPLISALPNALTFPRPALAIYGPRGIVYPNELITFDLRDTFFPNRNPHYLLIQFGELNFDGTPKWTVINSTETLVVRDLFHLGGLKRVNVTVSDIPFVWTGPSVSTALANGYPAPVLDMDFIVAIGTDCYNYDVKVDFNPASTITPWSDKTFAKTPVRLYITVRDHTGLASDPVMTKSFASIGDYPTVTTFNTTHTHTYTVPMLSDDATWQLEIAPEVFDSQQPVKLSIQSTGSIPFLCSIREFLHDISPPQLNVLKFGANMINPINNINPGLAIISTQYMPSSFQYTNDRCTRKEAVIVLGNSASFGSKNYLGSLILLSSDGFERQVRLVDLSMDASGSRTSTASLCGAGSLTDPQCKELEIQFVAMADQYVVFLTTQGLFMSESFLEVKAEPQASSFARIKTGVPEWDMFYGSINSSYSRVTSQSNCFSNIGGYIFLTYPSPGQTRVSNLLYTISDFLTEGKAWPSPITIASMGLSSNYSFIDAIHDYSEDTNLIFVGIIENPICTLQCTYVACKLLHQSGSSPAEVSFTFPTTNKMTGMDIHSNDLDIYVWGEGIWHSVDGGNNFNLQFTLPSNSTEVFVEARWASEKGGFLMLTNFRQAFYGRVSTNSLMPLRSLRFDPFWIGNSLIMDESGDIFVLSLAKPDYSISSYPNGFLASALGDFRTDLTAQGHYLRRYVLPLEDLLDGHDDSFNAALVPVFNSQNRVRMFSSGSDTFKFYHEGLSIRQPDGFGRAFIVSIAEDQSFADCITTLDFSADASPAVTQNLIITGISILLTTYTSIITVPQLTPIVLTLSGAGWRANDVGKTVVYSQGSFLITQFVNATVVNGVVYRAPFTTAPAVAGSWNLYDFRSTLNLATTASQTITVSNGGANSINVVLNAGILEFSRSLLGVWLMVGQGVGVITGYIDASTIKVSMYDGTVSAASYVAGSWALFRVSPRFIYGNSITVDVKARPWALQLDNCHWTSFASSSSEIINYVGYRENFTIAASINNNNWENLDIASKSYLGIVMSNPSIYKYSVDLIADNVYHSGVSLVLNDIGEEGENVISFRASAMSLLCKQTPQTIRLINGCPPTRYIAWDYFGYTTDDLLLGNPTILGNVELVYTLPTNYRPPSEHGVAVPVTSNFYNADPSKAKWNNRYSISKRSGAYKACAGKSNRTSCECTDKQRSSMSYVDTDCIDKVLSVFHQDKLTPNFLIYEYGMAPIQSLYLYRLVELNNRTDYCISSSVDCKSKESLNSAILDPTKDSITWTGSQLFHFRVETIESGYCKMHAEFAVYVIEPPPRTAYTITAMSITAIGFCAGMLAAYMYFNYKQTQGW